MSTHRTLALQYAHNSQITFLEELKKFASIPSISTNPNHRGEIEKAAEWVASHLRSLGIDKVNIMPTSGHPVVYGELLAAGNHVPTILIYGHYDVQPAEPLELWESDAFTPTQRGDNLYGRGVSDMKGQVTASLNAVEAITRTGEFPINLKFLFEGEEEIGSPSLAAFISEHNDLLSCDFALNPDAGMIDADTPTITYALRGLAYFELRLYGPDHDLHSGTFGGVVHNPAQAMCELIAKMHDEQGRITLPGFYDKVRLIDPEERNELARLPMDTDFYLSQTGAPALWGEIGFTPVERAGARPTLEVNGILSGYTGPGGKTVLPAWSMAKISTRLVPDQDPLEVKQQFVRFIESNVPSTIKWELEPLHGGKPSISNRHSQAVNAMCGALEAVWGKYPVFKREGGSVPVVLQFKERLGVDTVNAGFSLYDDKAHSPNEKLNLTTWYRGIDALIHFFFNMAGES